MSGGLVAKGRRVAVIANRVDCEDAGAASDWELCKIDVSGAAPAPGLLKVCDFPWFVKFPRSLAWQGVALVLALLFLIAVPGSVMCGAFCCALWAEWTARTRAWPRTGSSAARVRCGPGPWSRLCL